MKNLKKRLIALGLAGIISFSGCSLLPISEYGGVQPADMSKSPYADTIRKKADELRNSKELDGKASAAKAYGFIGDLKSMDAVIEEIILSDLNKGITYADIGKRFHDFYNKKGVDSLSKKR